MASHFQYPQRRQEGPLGTEDMDDTSIILRKSGRRDLPVTIRRCAREELDAIVALQRIVYRDVADKDTFVFTTEEELTESLESDICLGAYLDGRLIGFTLAVTDPDSPRNLGYALNYGPERCARCVTYDTTFVHPEYTGYGLQRVFMSLKDSEARKLGASEALATVSPDNQASLKNLIENGFEIADEKIMYAELRRYIMRKPLV